jgi:RNA polymerase sigma factor (sigma-70 family)
MRRGRSEHDAEDLVQEAWVRLASYAQEHEVVEPEALLMRAALNLSLDAHRVARNHGEQLVVDEVLLVDTAPGTEAIVLARERMVRLSECLGELHPRTRDIFLAHRVEGLRYQDIARRHGLSVSAVEKHIAKAVLLLSIGMEGW